uniref:Glycerol uptake facilitator and related permeases (Major Intrinsic protein Family) n=1 Tax=uncultured gamma proteobacterium HF0770_28K04 TaxID=723578 RepID=E7C7I8_9GAMM|nr:glycerol uptake facilitator and related permeases (Major Intrinsic protein Family) [uncultured gamma proteobacterium HF0770_28K04]
MYRLALHSSNKIIFIAELIGTFGLVVAAAGSMVYDAMLGGIYGHYFVVAMHFIGLAIVVYAFGKYSMAHFNPAVTIAFFITKHVKGRQLPYYFAAQAIGAFMGSIFVLLVMGDYANLGTNYPNPTSIVEANISYEILASIFLMGVIYIVVHFKKLGKLTGVAIGGIIALDVLFFGLVSGASMNPIRSLAPAIISGVTGDLWLYLTTPFIGTIIVAAIYKVLSGRTKNISTH